MSSHGPEGVSTFFLLTSFAPCPIPNLFWHPFYQLIHRTTNVSHAVCYPVATFNDFVLTSVLGPQGCIKRTTRAYLHRFPPWTEKWMVFPGFQTSPLNCAA